MDTGDSRENYQCIASISGRNRISDRGKSGLVKRKGAEEGVLGNGTPTTAAATERHSRAVGSILLLLGDGPFRTGSCLTGFIA
ncbi:hypothetical protein EVAR_81740_1 [Eumeta japonica]|uniref:Uncharacterized protein n=1 Tax=Eumeta variegata TaxID=151549 RepID=A0A4C1UHR5_EUMVA|nr:hypothetical protein EVAR_81740_1 [Eumeta japonica]